MNIRRDVAQFLEMLGFTYNGPPRQMPDDLKEFRIGTLQEEYEEYVEAVGTGDLEKQLDSLVDLIYFAVGNLVIQGMPFDEAWAIVHAANMKKKRGVTKRGHSFDAIKPEGWTPPDLSGLIDTFEGPDVHDCDHQIPSDHPDCGFCRARVSMGVSR